jgi:hypothetical protein
MMCQKNTLTQQPEYVTEKKEAVIFLTEPAKKDVIEALKDLERVKRRLLALVR